MDKRLIWRPIFVLLMGCTYLLSVFFTHHALHILMSVFAIFVVALFFPSLTGSSKFMISILLGISLLLFLMNDSIGQFFLSFETNVSILSIFIFVPLLGIPLRAAKYLNHLDVIYNLYIKSTRHLYLIINLMTYVLGVLMNLGAVSLVHQLTNTKTYRPYADTRYKALARAYPFAVLWSPYYITMAIVLTHFHVSWLELFPVGFTLATFGIFLGVYLERKYNVEIAATRLIEYDNREEEKRAWKKLYEFIIVVIVLTAIIMFIEHIANISVIPLIAVFSIILCIIWTLFYENIAYLFQQLKGYCKNNLSNMGNELTLFLSAGVFGNALMQIGAGDAIIYFLEIIGIDHPLPLILLIMIITTLLTFIGIHPIITLTVVAVTISTSPIFMDHHRIIAMGIIISWALSVTISPFSALTLMLSGITRLSTIEIGLKKNLKFTILLAVTSILFLSIIHVFFNY